MLSTHPAKSAITRCPILHYLPNFKLTKVRKLKIPLLSISFFALCCYVFAKTENGCKSLNFVRGLNGEGLIAKTSSNLTAAPRILCYILLSQKLLSAAKIIQETWGSKCDKIIFFGRFQSSEVPVTFLSVSEGYAYLWGKTKAALIYLQEQHGGEYDWYIKADSDTFVIVNNLKKFLLNLNPDNPVWFGYKLKHSKVKDGYMSGGAGYTFSKAALQRTVALLKLSSSEDIKANQLQCGIRGTKGYEDLELGKCFSHAGVKEVSTLDAEGRERFLPLPLNTLLSGDVSNFHWIWQKAWNPPRIGPDCCSKELISMHKISPEGMRTLHFLLETTK